MSSSYRRICLSHEPPLEIDEETDGHTPPLPPTGHPDCPVGLARYSGALVEVWLPTPYSDGRGSHPGRWYDVSWIHRFPSVARLITAETGAGNV